MKTYIDYDESGKILRVITAPKNYPAKDKERLLVFKYSPEISDSTHFVKEGSIVEKEDLSFAYSLPPYGSLFIDQELVLESEENWVEFSLDKENEDDVVHVRVTSLEYLDWEGEL